MTAVDVRVARLFGARHSWLVASTPDVLCTRLACLNGQLVRTRPLEGLPQRCVDLRALGQRCREEGAALVVDVSCCGPKACPAVRLGAHVALMTLGDDRLLVALSQDAQRALPRVDEIWDSGRGSPEEGMTSVGDELAMVDLEASLATRNLWWHQASDAAQVVASYLRCHPRVADLRYPGLKDDSSFAVAARTLQGGFGPWVDYRLQDQELWQRISCTTEDARTQVMALEQALK